MKQIEINEINVNYGEKPILKNFSYKINKSDKICIIGKNGSGKTSLVNCLCQLNEYTGEILYNHSDVNEIDIFEHVTYISQKPFLFSDSLDFNLFLNHEKDDVNMEFFEKLLEILELKTLYVDRSKESISLDDENISGGEKQKIALLRMLLTKPEIIVLDEALSMIDSHSRFEILKYLMKQKYTLIYITHNHKELKLFDKIIDFDNFK